MNKPTDFDNKKEVVTVDNYREIPEVSDTVRVQETYYKVFSRYINFSTNPIDGTKIVFAKIILKPIQTKFLLIKARHTTKD